MPSDAEYLVLKAPTGWMPEKELEALLDAAVKNHSSPTDGYTPEYPLKHNEYPRVESPFKASFSLHNGVIHGHNFQATIQGLGKLRWAKSTGSQLDLCQARLYTSSDFAGIPFMAQTYLKGRGFQRNCGGMAVRKAMEPIEAPTSGVPDRGGASLPRRDCCQVGRGRKDD
ncbi:hypothetical protein ABEF95_003800 [Exophiala dermatitidis]